MRLTQEQYIQATSKIEKITVQMTDTYIRHYETEIKFIQEKAKLSLWIIGLSIGMELFVLNRIELGVLSNCLNAILFYSIGATFVINAFIGLLLRLKQARLMNHLLSVQTQYDYQRAQILLNLEPDCKLQPILIKDIENGVFSDKILNIKYIESQVDKDDPLTIKASDFILKSDNWPSSLLVIQAVLTIIFFVSVF